MKPAEQEYSTEICSSKRKSSSLALSSDSRSKKINLISTESNSSKSTTKYLSLTPVLPDEYERKMETELMYVGKVTKREEISRLVKELSRIWPLTGKPNLKRVRRTAEEGDYEIIICPVSDVVAKGADSSNTIDKLELIISNVQFNTVGLADCVSKCSVPKFPALTRAQYEESAKIWPIQFHEDKYIAKVLSDQLFNVEEKENMSGFMKMAIEVAKCGKKVQVGAVIVNPVCKEVIAVAHDQRHQHPLQHATMLAIDLVARIQGGGCWNVNSTNMSYASNIMKCTDGTDKSFLPYLCTSYDLYVTREPCIMCAMALVHSRIRRVFIGNTVPWGALGSHYKLHVQPGLNHHYEVWKGLMMQECQLLKMEEPKSS